MSINKAKSNYQQQSLLLINFIFDKYQVKLIHLLKEDVTTAFSSTKFRHFSIKIVYFLILMIAQNAIFV